MLAVLSVQILIHIVYFFITTDIFMVCVPFSWFLHLLAVVTASHMILVIEFINLMCFVYTLHKQKEVLLLHNPLLYEPDVLSQIKFGIRTFLYNWIPK